jgi:hypothetical protein
MKHPAIRSTLLVISAVGLLLGCGGAKEYVIVGTSRAAGADGTVRVEEIEGGNSLVTIEMKHMPPPERLGAGLKEYILWFETAESPAMMVSRVAYDPKKREAKATATTPKKKFTVKITAEKSVQVSNPSDVVVAKQQVGAK